MANYSQAFGYNTYLVPLKSGSLNLAQLSNYDTFINQAQAISGSRALLVSGSGSNIKMAYGGATAFTITTVALASNVVTVTTSAAHGLVAGDLAMVKATTNTTINGTFAVKAAPSATTFTYDLTGTNITSGADTGSVVGGSALALDGTDKPVLLKGLTNCSLSTDTNTENIQTYDDETQGYDQTIATSKSFSLDVAGMTDFTDLGYKLARMIEKNNVSSKLMGKLVRVGPVGTVEATYGFVRLTNFQEPNNEAGSVVSWSVTANGYGPYEVKLDN
jgi:hypothetical protein